MSDPIATSHPRGAKLLARGRRWVLCAAVLGACAAAVYAQQPDEKFRKLARQVAEERLSGQEEIAAGQEQALGLLDEMVTTTLAGASAFDLNALNQRLARLAAGGPPMGESYEVVRLREHVFALVANFTSSGPAAVRLYWGRPAPAGSAPAGAPVPFARVARIDRATHADFFDENVELLPIPPPGAPEGSALDEAVFVTVSGRTDDLHTGAFTAWRFREGKLEPLWSSDILQQSSYEVASGELRLTFCGETDDDRPRICRRMVRERYGWQQGAWKRLEQADVPFAKP